MEQLSTLADIVAASGADPQCIWTAQGLPLGGGAWAHDGAIAVGGPGLSGQDRIVVRGRAAGAARVVREAVNALGPSYVVAGDPAVMSGVVDQLCWLEPHGGFGWMDATRRLPHRAEHRVRWLARNEWRAADSLLTAAAPGSSARPGQPGVRRWAGITDTRGWLTCTAAEAWSVPSLGFLAGLAVRPDMRRSGQGRDVCAFVLDALLAAHGRAALIVVSGNDAAARLFGRLGFSFRQQHTARMTAVTLAREPAVAVGQM